MMTHYNRYDMTSNKARSMKPVLLHSFFLGLILVFSCSQHETVSEQSKAPSKDSGSSLQKTISKEIGKNGVTGLCKELFSSGDKYIEKYLVDIPKNLPDRLTIATRQFIEDRLQKISAEINIEPMEIEITDESNCQGLDSLVASLDNDEIANYFEQIFGSENFRYNPFELIYDNVMNYFIQTFDLNGSYTSLYTRYLGELLFTGGFGLNLLERKDYFLKDRSGEFRQPGYLFYRRFSILP